MELSGRLALVTGAGVRLGRALAEGLAGAGANLALHYNRHRAEAEAFAEQVRASGRAAACFSADLREPRETERMALEVERAMGPVDVLVLSAAVWPSQPLESLTPASFEETLRINLTSPFLLARALGLRMKERGEGAILFVLDWSMDRPYIDRIPYTMAKAGLRAAVFGLSRALAPAVRVNGLAPGAVLLPEGAEASLTDRIRAATPLQRIGTPEDVVGAALYLLQSGDFVTGSVLTVDGGRSAS